MFRRRCGAALRFACLLAAACSRRPAPGASGSPAPLAAAASAARVTAASGERAPASQDGGAGRSLGGEAQAQERVATFLARVAATRELPATSSVQSSVLDRAALLRKVRDHVAREVPGNVLRNQGELLIAFGWVPPDFDYEEGAFRLLEAQLAGFYEPSDKRMYLAADLDEAAADATLAHELVHALQDQHYDLGSHLTYEPEANDRESALQGLAEGDATSAMMELMLSGANRRATEVPDDLFAAQVESSMSADAAGAARAPRVLLRSLIAPYVDGVVFVHQLRRREQRRTGGGSGWGAVDQAWRSPPTTTEQLLHLEKYDAHEPAETIPRVPPPGDGWSAAYDDIFGEQGLRIGLEQWLSVHAAKTLAAGWAGDRAVLFRRDGEGQLAGAWRIRYDVAPGDAGAYAKRAYDALSRALGATSSSSKTAPSFCKDRAGLGPIVVARAGRELAVVGGPYRRDGARVVADGHCPAALAWAAAILGTGPK
jgi:hypothetical protein